MEFSQLKHGILNPEKKSKLSYYFSEFQPDHPTLVLLPGSFLPACQYEDTLPFFQQTINIIVVEYRGHGDSWPPIKRGSITRLAGDVSVILKHLSVPQFFIGGHSIGGMIALEMGRMCPNQVLGIISIEGWTNSRAAKNAYHGNLEVTYSKDQALKRQLMREAVLKRWNKRQKAHFGSLWHRWDGAQFLRETSIPILEIYGDRGVSPPTQQALEIPLRSNIHFTIIPNASHNIPIQEPEVLAHEIEKFIFTMHS